MAFSTSSGIPAKFVIGDAYSFTVSDSEHPAPDWTSKILFKNQAGTVQSYDGAAASADHQFDLDSADTTALTAGPALVCIVFTDTDSHRQTTDWLNRYVLPNPAAAEPVTAAQTMVTNLLAAITSLSSGTNASVSIDGISYTKRDLKSLNDQLVQWQAAVAAEKRAADTARGITRTRIRNRFVCS